MRGFRQSRPWPVLILSAVLLPAGIATAVEITAEERYASCLKMVNREPMQAYESARAWEGLGGGLPALHCAALALSAAGKPVQAAALLEGAADQLGDENDAVTADLWGQAGNMRLLADEYAAAASNLRRALAKRQDDPDLLVDLARAEAGLAHYQEALAQLDRAIALHAQHADAHAFRAAALRHLGDLPGALAAVDQALALDAEHGPARFERGLIHHHMGQREQAKADWLHVAERHAGTPAGDAAQFQLQQLHQP